MIQRRFRAAIEEELLFGSVENAEIPEIIAQRIERTLILQ
jgi:hypothetical protein